MSLFTLGFELKLEADEKRSAMCPGCLSFGRDLSTVRYEYLTFYYQLLGQNRSPEEEESKYLKIKMCWECKALLHKTVKFQMRIREANMYMQQYKDIEMPTINPLTNLKTIVQSSFNNIYFEHEEDTNEHVPKIKRDLNCSIEITSNAENLNVPLKEEESPSYSDNYDNEDAGTKESELTIPQSVSKVESDKTIQVTYKRERKKQIIRTYKKYVEIVNPGKQLGVYFTKVPVSGEALADLLVAESGNPIYLAKQYKCVKCIYGFTTADALRMHNRARHNEDKDFLCNICETSCTTKQAMVNHMRLHYVLYKCNACDFVCVGKWMQREHLKTNHTTLFICRICRLEFSNGLDFSRHYKQSHAYFICDYCGRRYIKKPCIANHIKRTHCPLACKACGRVYDKYRLLMRHYRTAHPECVSKRVKTEDSYCVECDKQFVSEYKYKNHLRNSVRHTPRKKLAIPCPECGKIFTRTTYMNNHYKLTHVKKSKHYCQLCDKYYITGFSLRQHKKLVHDKIARPKDKICKMCGKGFATNRTLTYHIRTHTGERPHQCDHCTASFSQKKSLTSHVKAIHAKTKG